MENENMLEIISTKQMVTSLMEMNSFTSKFGIEISKKDALLLIEERRASLKEQQRIEFGEGILPKLMKEFIDSPYIYQSNFVEVINKLQDIFYEYKNESNDLWSDDEMLDFMKEKFEGECEGSLEYLEETILEDFAREIRMQGQDFLENYYRERDIEDE